HHLLAWLRDVAPLGHEEVRNRRSAEIDDDVPVMQYDLAPQFQPMPPVASLLQDMDPVESGHRAEDVDGRRAARDRDPGARMPLDQAGKYSRRQHGIADPRVGDEQD